MSEILRAIQKLVSVHASYLSYQGLRLLR